MAYRYHRTPRHGNRDNRREQANNGEGTEQRSKGRTRQHKTESNQQHDNGRRMTQRNCRGQNSLATCSIGHMSRYALDFSRPHFNQGSNAISSPRTRFLPLPSRSFPTALLRSFRFLGGCVLPSCLSEAVRRRLPKLVMW